MVDPQHQRLEYVPREKWIVPVRRPPPTVALSQCVRGHSTPEVSGTERANLLLLAPTSLIGDNSITNCLMGKNALLFKRDCLALFFLVG